MSSLPVQRYICPQCRASYAELTPYCTSCGANMASVSPLEAARAQSVARKDTTTQTFGQRRQISDGDRRVNEANRAWLGKLIDGRYRVIEAIGRGGVGVIYKVEHIRMGKIAAMKVLHRDLTGDVEMRQRFEREAAAVSLLQHPNTVQVFDFGTADGAMYLIMEYVRGIDMALAVERDGPMPFSRAAPLLIQICGALGEAHEQGIIHRDLKPENVLITRTTGGRDFAKVLDFGLAKLDDREVDPGTTDRSTIVGTPYFMAPEQIRGDDVDPRADLYSFGALMFNILTGQHLFTANSAVGVLTKHLTVAPDAPSKRRADLNIHPKIDEICLRALEKDRAHRYANVNELAIAIEAAYDELVGDISSIRAKTAQGGDTTAHTLDTDVRLQRSDLDDFELALRRRTRLIWVAAALGALTVVGAAIYVLAAPPKPVSAEREPNHQLKQANLLVPGKAVTGTLGKRLSQTEGDRDVYRIKWLPSPARGDEHVVEIDLSAVPNLDTQLVLIGADGVPLQTINDQGVGQAERVPRLRLRGAVSISVEQAPGAPGMVPLENISDRYTLSVTQAPLELADVETEPNNTASDATPLPDQGELRGQLTAADAVEYLRWVGTDRSVTLTLRGEARLGLNGAWHNAGTHTLKLRGSDSLRVERVPNATSGPIAWRLTLK